jgi:hypothetical protein
MADYYSANKAVEEELDGVPYTVRYTPPVKGKHAKPSVLTISTDVDCDHEFDMVVEKWFDKFCKKLGVAVEVQTGDDKFDDECYIRTDSPAFTAAYLADPVKRIAILDLRRFGFLDVTLKDGTLSATWSGFDPDKHHRDDLSAEVAARLVLLARDLPAEKPEFAERTGGRRRVWQVVLWVFLAGFALTLLSLIAYSPTHGSDLLLLALPVLLVGWPAFAVLSAWLVRGTSRSHYTWGWLMLGSLFLFPVGSAGAVSLLNGVLDVSNGTTHDAVINEKYTTRSKGKTKYHVRVQSWRDAGDTESFQVGFNEFQAVTPNKSKVVVVTRSGGLGIEWIESKRVAP